MRRLEQDKSGQGPHDVSGGKDHCKSDIFVVPLRLGRKPSLSEERAESIVYIPVKGRCIFADCPAQCLRNLEESDEHTSLFGDLEFLCQRAREIGYYEELNEPRIYIKPVEIYNRPDILLERDQKRSVDPDAEDQILSLNIPEDEIEIYEKAEVEAELEEEEIAEMEEEPLDSRGH
ncbi:hypothetical protein JW711_06245 [Candidatus Woesearchaeota archaeon]|nr:hypothetical protein [Candidatus Woesearchaeota archaeon]